MSRRRPSAGPGPVAEPWQALARALARAAWEAGRGATPPAAPFPVALCFTVTPGARWVVAAVPTLEEQVRRAVREAGERRDVYRQGRVWCYRCESSDCRHAGPPAPSKVFGGYTATGLPAWVDLTEMLLELRHPGVDRAFGSGRSALTAAEVPPERLRERQLEAFGRDSKTYDVIAEAIVGPVRLEPGDAAGGAERVALTLQAVESRDARGRVRFHGNVLGRLADGAEALEALADAGHPRLLEILRTARRRIAALAAGSAGAGAGDSRAAEAARARAAAAVREAVRALERLGRQGGRRTAHAEDRGRARRPTGNALEDASGASPECLLRDERRGTVVVLGPRERVHVFTPDGRHVTTLLLDADAVRRRRSRERWEPLPREERQRFLAGLASLADGPAAADEGPRPARR